MGIENGLLRDIDRSLILNIRTGAVPLSQTRLGVALDSNQAVIAGAAPASPGATDKMRNGILLTLDNCPYFTFTEPATKKFSNDVVTDANGSIWGTSSPSGGTRWTYNMLLGDVLIDGRGAVVVNTPAAEANNAAWYRYGIGLTDAGAGACSAWADQSGNARNLTAAGSARPTIQADGSLLFDGVANDMTAVLTLNQPCSIYLLFKQITWTSGDRILTGGTDVIPLTQNPSSPQLRVNAGVALTNASGLTLGTYGVLATVLNGASSVLQINANTAGGDAGTANPGGFNLGGNLSTNFANIQVKEVLLFPAAHSADTRSRIIRYLASVGGLSI